jgi:hypothetical protein
VIRERDWLKPAKNFAVAVARLSKVADKFASQRSSITPELSSGCRKASPFILIFRGGCHIVRAFSGIGLELDELTIE